MKIIGIGGTNGSGKDTLGELLEREYNYLFISVTRHMLRREARSRGLPIERENLRAISAEWRREGGLSVLVDKAIAEFKKVQKNYDGLAIASLRNPGEVDRIHKLGGKVVWVDADPKLRFGRVMERKRGTEDAKTYAQFLAEEKAEMAHSGDEATLNMSAVKAKADIFITNDSNNIEDFKKAAQKSLTDFI